MKHLFTFLSALILFTACDKEDAHIENEEEVITTLNYTLTPTSGTAITASFQDLDGDGAGAATIDSIILSANTTYTGVFELLNETESPAENITEEVSEEDEDHQFFFISGVSGLSVAYNDEDADGNPIGIQNTLTTGAAGSGTLTVVLRHEPNKSGTDVASGDISNAGGETDIEVVFNVIVQ
jgi:hypothetical protein